MISASRALLKQCALRIPILSSLVLCNPTGLVALPLEILVEIMKELEWNDVLRVRQTCKQLCEASKARPIWLCLFEKHSQYTSPERYRPDKPIHKYSRVELEGMVLRWKAAEIGWAMDGRVPLQEHHLWMPEDSSDYMHVVRGGRWLLATNIHGAVRYYDLDAPERPARQLIPASFEDARVNVFMSVDMDLVADDLPTDKSLAFNLGLLLVRLPDYDPETYDSLSPGPSQQCIQVWRITFHDDDDSLHARCLSAFPEEAIATTKGFTLSGTNVAYSLLSFLGGRISCTVIVDWESANDSQMDHQRRYISDVHADGAKIYFLPEDKIFIASNSYLQVYDLRAAPQSNERPSRHTFPDQQPIWSTELTAFNPKSISQPFLTHDSSRIVLVDNRGVFGLIIPKTNLSVSVDREPHIVDLLPNKDLRNRHRHAFGYHRGIGICTADTILYQYRWPEEDGDSCISFGRLRNVSSYFCMDEYSGRIVTTSSNLSDHYILQFPVAYDLQRHH